MDHPKAVVDLVKYCTRVYNRGYAPGTSGNISTIENNVITITPTGCCLGEIEAPEMLEIPLEGFLPGSLRKPSSEYLMHQAIYKVRPDMRAIIHCHPPKATGLAAAHQTIDQPLIAEMVVHYESIPLVPYYLPGSPQLADAVSLFAQQSNVMLLANHGVVAMGETLREAFHNLETLESLAEIYIIAHTLPGGPKPLRPEQVNEILKHKAASQPQDSLLSK